MVAIGKKLRGVGDGLVAFHCPGCDDTHHVRIRGYDARRPSWDWNGAGDRPTFTPSILVRSGHYLDPDLPCWCTFKERTDEEPDFECGQCHSFVTDGRIQFLADCSHALAGQTVDIPDWDSV